MERNDVKLLAGVFLVAFTVGLFSYQAVSGQEKFSVELNATVDASNGVKEVSFDNRSFKLLHDNSAEGNFFLEVSGEGMREIDIIRDGEVHQKQLFVTLKGRTYLLYLRYTDAPGERDDAWMTVYRVEEV